MARTDKIPNMRRIIISLLTLLTIALSASAQDITYKIIYEKDTTIRVRVGGVNLGSRDVRRVIYEYPSKDVDGKPVTISGVMMIPSNIINGTPCDGIMLFNRATLSSPDECPTTGNQELINGLIANPLSPNYILVMSDFIGYGSSIEYPSFYHSGDVNARNSLDGLLAARQILNDQQLPQGKYLFNLGFSQGGSESLYVAKLRDMEYKDRGVTFTKTFAGGGPTDYVIAYKEYVKRDWCEDCKDVVMMMISCVENCHLNIDYKDLFKEPLASGAKVYVKTKDKGTLGEYGVSMEDSLHNLIQPAYMDINSDEAKAFMAALERINLMNGWEPDVTQKYFIEHSRHDNYVPIQCVRAIIPWMKEKGFTQSLVPGKTNLQTNTLVFKLNHTLSAVVWLIQTVAAIQFWPIVYYEGEQNRYYHDVVKDLNLMKVVKYLESWGLDLRKLIQESSSAPMLEADLTEAVADGTVQLDGSVSQLRVMNRSSVLDIFDKISETLAKVDLTIDDVLQMLDDSGITLMDVLEVYSYLTTTPEPEEVSQLAVLNEKVEAPVYLLRYYEQMLANWFLQGGFDVEYDKWGW